MLRRLVDALVGLAVILAFAVQPSVAQESNVQSIKGLIADRCAQCHIAPQEYDDTGVDPPSFSQIRADPETYTEERLRRFLVNPHWPMSQFVLSSKDIDRIVLYLKTNTSAQ